MKNLQLLLMLVIGVLAITACNNGSNRESAAPQASVTRQTDAGIDARELLAQLDSAKCSLVVYNNDTTTQYTQRGVRDMYNLVTTRPEALRGAHVADKIVGMGAAALHITGGVKQLSTHIVTTPALKMLRDAGVEVYFEEEVPYIINRKKTGQCPLDSRLQGLTDAKSCLPVIKQFIEDLDNGLINV